MSLPSSSARGLAAAHAEGIVHRDLKPENVLFDEAGNLCIGDFGVATSIRTGQAATTAGTPRYMSPEQLDSQAVDERSDIYSLGLILYELATSEVPLGDGSTATIMFRRATESPRDPQALNAALSPHFATIVLRCLERDPARRFQTAR